MPRREHHDPQRAQHERETRLAEALARLDDAVGAIHDSEAFRRYLEVQARFHRYSYGNVLLILAQRPDATRIAGYRAWQSLGRQVRRGERGIKILVPMKVREPGGQTTPDAGDAAESAAMPQDPGPSADPASVRRRLLFGVGTVFDISQTDGEPLATIDVPVLTGTDGAALYGRMEAVARKDGLTVERGNLRLTRPETMGFYSPTERLIVVREAAQIQMTKTLAHELAHHYGDHRLSDAESETIAESVAYVTLAHYGLDSGLRSFPYVATWRQQPAVLRAALHQVETVSRSLIDRVRTPVDACTHL
jgi:antirestriction protein ArdC